MIPTYKRQIDYMTRRMSQADVSREIGLPTRIVRAIAKGTREIDSTTRNDIRNAYRRVAYASLRESGVPISAARSWSSLRPETSSVKQMLWEYKIADMTVGALGAQAFRAGIKDIQGYINENYDSVYANILTGVEEQESTLDELEERYPSLA